MNRFPLPGHSIEQVFDSYCQYLALTFGRQSRQLKAFVDRYNENPESPRSEAVVFTWLSNIGMSPTVNEDPAKGGMDFACHPASGKNFLVEVTCIGNEAMAEETGLSLELVNGVGGAYGLGTEMLRRRVGAKMEQMANANLPRILVMTSEHPKVTAVFNATGAISLFVSKPAILVPFDGSKERQVTDLSTSVFFKPDRNNPANILPARQAASAVVLMAINVADVRPIGLLHPAAAKPLPIDDWYQTPFVYLKNWPIADGKIGIDWTMPPDLPPHTHQRLRLENPAER